MQSYIISALSKFKSIIDLCVYFSNDANAYSFLEKLRWGTTVVCPYCGSTHTFKIGEGHRHKCNDCKKSFTALVGMVFQSTKLPLVKWNGVTINKIEGLWGEFQRMVIGTYHRLSKKHLQRYLDELVFRYNSLEMGVEDRYLLMFGNAYQIDYKMVELRRRMNKYQLKTDIKLVA